MHALPGRCCSSFGICDLNATFEILPWQTSVYLENIVFPAPPPSSLSFNASFHRSVNVNIPNVNIQSHLCCASWAPADHGLEVRKSNSDENWLALPWNSTHRTQDIRVSRCPLFMQTQIQANAFSLSSFRGFMMLPVDLFLSNFDRI